MNDSDPDSDDSYQKELAHVYENQNKNYISLGPGRKEFLIECVKSRAQWTETIFYTNIDLTDFPDRRKDESRSQRKKRGHGAKARQKEARRVRDLISDVPLARQQKPQTLLEKETGLIKPVKPKVRIDCTTSNYFELYENFPVCRMPNNPQEETDFDKKYPHRKHFYYANVAKITKAVRNWINQRESKKESPRLAFYPDGLINLESLELEGMKNFGESKAEDKIILQSRNKLNCCLNFIWPVDISKAGKVRKRRRDDRTYEWMILWCDWDVIAKLPKFMMIVDCVNDYRTEKKELPGGGYYHAIDIFCRKHHVIEALCMSLLYLHCGSVLLKPNVTNHMFLDMISNLERPPRGQRHLVKFESDPFTCFSRELCEFLAVKQGYKSFMTHNEWEKSCVKDVQGRYFWYNSRWRETPFMRMGHESMELFKVALKSSTISF